MHHKTNNSSFCQTLLNQQLSKKFKLEGRHKSNYLVNTLTILINVESFMGFDQLSLTQVVRAS
jgi:hypothetical protein